MSDQTPMPGDWYAQLSPVKQKAYNATETFLGADIALWLFGWYRYIRAWTQAHKESKHGNR